MYGWSVSIIQIDSPSNPIRIKPKIMVKMWTWVNFRTLCIVMVTPFINVEGGIGNLFVGEIPSLLG